MSIRYAKVGIVTVIDHPSESVRSFLLIGYAGDVLRQPTDPNHVGNGDHKSLGAHIGRQGKPAR
jgi:hypothetical protein